MELALTASEALFILFILTFQNADGSYCFDLWQRLAAER
jgi:hypothetical protein